MGMERFLGYLKTKLGGLSEEEARARLLAKYGAFRRLVDANTEALEVMADMQAKATGEYLFDRAYVDGAFARLEDLSSIVVQNIQDLSGGRHKALQGALDKVTSAARQEAGQEPSHHHGPSVLPLAAVKDAPLDLVGGKIRRLSEIMKDARLPVPDGFCITTPACEAYMRQKGLLETISEDVARMSLKDKEELNRTSEAVKAKVLAARWPEDLARAILDAHAALEERAGPGLRVSVRSSAVGEDGEFSFAGQFDTVLNVSRESLLTKCQEVLASQFGPRALVYLKARGASAGVLPMAVGVIAMVDARASGVMYTRDPQEPRKNVLVVAGLWGLGSLTVDGSVNPDVFTLSRGPEPALQDAKVSVKERMLLCGEAPGLVNVDVPGWMRDQPCLSKDQLALLGTYGMRLEKHFGRPQDVEWALGSQDNLFILQSRPLRLSAPSKPARNVMALRQGLVSLVGGGVVACRGIAAGPVFLLASEEDVHRVPAGAVLVAKTSSPKLAEAVDRVAAIVTEAGSAASHLATVAREFGIPSIFGAPEATDLLKAGTTVTVDADLGSVYEGRAEALLASAREDKAGAEQPPLLKRFRESLTHVTPLNLTDPRSPDFRASRCKTIHDILRFAHEEAVQEMFLAGSLASKGTRNALKLRSTLPVDFFFIDLGGGLKATSEDRAVTPEAFACRPLIPLWEGMTQVPWRTEAAAGARDMASLFANTMTARDALEQAASPNYVIVSEAYLNLSFRLGYHFSRVDAYLSDRPEDNYASFLFHGGAADLAGKTRRVRFLEGALGAAGFQVHSREDALFARTGHVPPREMALRLRALGRLLVMTRQADTLFGDDAQVNRALAAYEAGDVSLGLEPREEEPT